MEVLPHRSWVEISRSRLASNFRAVRALVGPRAEVVPVVKADAYGHGAVEVARVVTAEGAGWLAVSCVEEGVALRDAGIRERILVMADCFPFSRAALVDYGLTPVVHSLEELAELNEYARSRQRRLRYHLKLDSGMGRLGTRAGTDELAAAVHAAEWLDLEGLMTHFASAADFTSTQTDTQVAEFGRVRAALAHAGIVPKFLHAASTNSIAFGRRDAWYNMVRPGHALYGYLSPGRGDAPYPQLHVEPVLTWKARVLTIKNVPAGAPVGYGAMFRPTRPSRIAVLAVGYADGLPHRLSARGRVIACGQFVPIVGAISMDLTTIDATDVPALEPGAPVTLLGEEGGVSINAQQMGRMAGTISYDILCGIRTRVARVYV